jgi:hypothetical protein
MVFSERIKKRLALWWGLQESRRFYTRVISIHRIKEHYTLRARSDMESKWHCCQFWQRTLNNKWNAREFAQKYGCRVPTLYWFGREISSLPFDSLPDSYVIKPNIGWSRKDVYAMAEGIDLLTDTTYTKIQLGERLRQVTRGLLGQPILVEEFVTEDGEYRLPTEYKCHVFGEMIAAIQVIQRSANKRDTRHRFYTEQWKIFADPMSTKFPPSDYIDPPECLNDMVTMARKLGRAYGTYVRVDFYVSKSGCVFGEFEATPTRSFTEYADDYFGALWQETFPDKI